MVEEKKSTPLCVNSISSWNFLDYISIIFSTKSVTYIYLFFYIFFNLKIFFFLWNLFYSWTFMIF